MRAGWGVAVALVVATACKAGADAGAGVSVSEGVSVSDGVSVSAGVEAGAVAGGCAGLPSLDERTREARSLYGDGVRTAVVDGAFLFVDADRGPLFDEALRFAPPVLAALRRDRIRARPLCPVSVHVFGSEARFRDHCAARGYVPEGGPDWAVYDRRGREIVVDLSRGRAHVPGLAHELAHVLMDADVDAKAPRWFRECVGTLYESPVLTADGQIHGTPDWRYPQLRAALAAGDAEAHLGALFGMSDAVFRGETDAGPSTERALLHYATARAACEWLDEQPSGSALWPFYAAWRDARARGEDAGGAASFARATGRTPEDADAAWRAWAARTK